MGKGFKLRNGMLLLSTEAPGGIYNSAQLKKLAALADGEFGIVKATEDQRLGLFVKPELFKQVATELKSVGLGLRNYQDGLHQPVACLGKHCSEAQQDALASAMDLGQELAAVTVDTPLRIGINGCARCCVPTHTLDVSIIGDSNGYRVSLGGKNSQIPEMATFMAEGVPAAKLPKLIAKVVQVYKGLAQKDETLQETMERAGSRKFIEALAPYSQDAAGGGDDPFGGLDAAGGGDDAGPTVEDHDDELAFDKEPAVEDFDSESLDAGEDGDVAVEDLPAAASDEPLALDGGEELGDVEPGGDFDIEGDAAFEASGEDTLGDDPLAIDDDISLDDALEPEAVAPKARQAAPKPALASDDELSLDDLEEETLGSESATGGDELDLAELETESLEESATAGGDGIDLDELSEDGADLDFDPQATKAAAAAAGPDEDFEAIEVTVDDVPSAEAAPAKPAATAAPAKPAATAAPAKPAVGAGPTLDDELLGEEAAGAEEVDGEAADEFEEKLNASIAEEESMPIAEDLHSHTRLEAMKLVEAGGDAQGSIHEDLHVDGGFENLGIDADEDDVASSTPAPPPAHMPARAQAPAVDPAKARSTGGGGGTGASHELELVAMEFTREGRLSLRFSTGAAIMLDPKTIKAGSSRELMVAGKKVLINSQSDGFSVEVDGVGVFLPLAAA